MFFFQLLYTSIEHIDRKLSGTAGILTLYCKNFMLFKLIIPGQEEATNIASSIEALSTLGTYTEERSYVDCNEIHILFC